ncbi:MAG: LysM peptidoglycan-binding domain-containing protein [Planctomycetes bacterium]|nr:LysM peptidoglycan-binding domain-containing protein [Planctomycetota bacterium]
MPNEASELSDLLGQLAGTVIYSRQHRLAPAHRVQLGETLESIAGVYQVPWQLLAKINGLPSPANVTVGQELKVIQGPFSAVVSTERRELVVLVGGRYAGRFAVGIGRDAQVVEGEWSVNQKQINPAYNGPSGTIAADDPTNPLGEHLIGLSAPSAAGASSSFGVQSIGIHGTHDPSSIQADDPRGFVRLAPRDAEDVYDILTIGSKVTIRR